VAALVVAGCGGGRSAVPDRLTKDQFTTRAQAICVATDKQLEKAGRLSGPHHMSERLFVDTWVAPIIGRAIDRLAVLRPPASDEAEVEAMIDAARRGLRKLESDPDSLRAEEGSAGDPFREFSRRSRAFGISC
jgi:hypothetical protein